jgi:hypothetical protein
MSVRQREDFSRSEACMYIFNAIWNGIKWFWTPWHAGVLVGVALPLMIIFVLCTYRYFARV